MCLKKKKSKNAKKKEVISERSASRLDDKERKIISKEMYAVYHDHMDKKKHEFRPAKLEEINVHVVDIYENDVKVEKVEQNKIHSSDNISVKSKKSSSRSNSKVSSKSSLRGSRKSSIVSSIISNKKEEIIGHITHDNTFSRRSSVESQQKEIDLSSECSAKSSKSSKNYEEDHSIVEKIDEHHSLINGIVEGHENEIVHTKEIHSEVFTNNSEIIHEENTISHEIHEETVVKHHESVHEESVVKHHESVHETSVVNHHESIHVEKDTIHHESSLVEDIVSHQEITHINDEGEHIHYGYHIPDEDSIHSEYEIINTTTEIHSKGVENIVDEVEGTMNVVKELLGEDINNNYECESVISKNITLENHTDQEHVYVSHKESVVENHLDDECESVISKTLTVETHINEESNVIKNNVDNIITTTYYEEIFGSKDHENDHSSEICREFYGINKVCGSGRNSIVSDKGSSRISNSAMSNHKEEEIKISHRDSVYSSGHHEHHEHQEKHDHQGHHIPTSSSPKHSRKSSTSLLKKEASISSKRNSVHDDKDYTSSKRNSVHETKKSISSKKSSVRGHRESISSLTSIGSEKSSLVTSKHRNSHQIHDHKEKNTLVNAIKVMEKNSSNLEFLYKPKRKTQSVKSIDTSLSYGFPTKRHLVEHKEYREIKKITEYQIDNKMEFSAKYNDYYLMKPCMVETQCKYTGGKKFIIGGEQEKSANDKKIIFFGTKGSGKTTLINNYCNILYGVGRSCNFRFVVNCPKGITSTKEVTTYEFNNTILGYKFTIIDTPGYDCSLPSSETFSYKTLYEIYLKNYISKANRILIHGVNIVVRNEDDIWNSKFYRQISGIRRIFCGNYQNKNLYPIITNAKAFSKLNYFDEELHGVYNKVHSKEEAHHNSDLTRHVKRRANWYTDVYRMTSNIYEKEFEGKKSLDKIYLYNETEAATEKMFEALQNNLPILLKKKVNEFETIYEC